MKSALTESVSVLTAETEAAYAVRVDELPEQPLDVLDVQASSAATPAAPPRVPQPRSVAQSYKEQLAAARQKKAQQQ